MSTLTLGARSDLLNLCDQPGQAPNEKKQSTFSTQDKGQLIYKGAGQP
jgi:hypothetical protein